MTPKNMRKSCWEVQEWAASRDWSGLHRKVLQQRNTGRNSRVTADSTLGKEGEPYRSVNMCSVEKVGFQIPVLVFLLLFWKLALIDTSSPTPLKTFIPLLLEPKFLMFSTSPCGVHCAIAPYWPENNSMFSYKVFTCRITNSDKPWESFLPLRVDFCLV